MKFSEKLMNLRKSKGWSQDEFAQQIGVTRQTVSKWELDQTVPDMNKLIEISKVFGISLDELVNDIEKQNVENTSNEPIIESPIKKNNKDDILKIIIIVIVVGCIAGGILLIKLHNDEKRAEKGIETIMNTFNEVGSTAANVIDKAEKSISDNLNAGSNSTTQSEKQQSDNLTNTYNGMSNSIMDTYNTQSNKIMGSFEQKSTDLSNEYKQGSEAIDEDINKFAFNSNLKYMQGTKSQFTLSQYLDKVVTSNKTNKNHLIEVTYNETTSTEEADIVAIKHSLKDGNSYEVSVDYDSDGYIYKVTIKDI